MKKSLTKREIEVLSLIASGKSTKEVADTLYVSTKTVYWHLDNIYKKRKVHNREAASKEATKLGIVPYEPRRA